VGQGRHRWARRGALLLAFAVVATACGDDDDDETADDTAAETTAATEGTDDTGATETTTADTAGEDTTTTEAEPTAACEETVAGSEITYGVFALTNAVDPPNSSGALVGGSELINVYDALMAWNPETASFEPRVAESLEPNDDFTEWTLTLPAGLTYSDGTPFDTANLAAHLDRFVAQGVRNNASGYMTLIAEREIVDEQTMVFHLTQPWASFGFMLADEPGQVVNVSAIGADPAVFGVDPPDHAGIGPYVVESFVPNERIVLTARDDYWGGPVCLETINFVFVPGSRATYEAFQAGDLDVGFLREADVVADARDAGENEIMVFQDAGNMVMFNHREGRPAADPLVREAMVNAFDQDAINERIFQGDAQVMRSLVHPESPLGSEDIEQAPHDAERAAEALQEAMAAGFDGVVDVLCTDRPPGPDLCLTIEAMLEAVGFTVNTVLLPQNDQIGRVSQGDYDITQFGFNVSSSTGFAQLFINLPSTSPRNRMGYANPEMDAAVAAVGAAATEEERLAAIAEVNNIFVADNAAFSFNAVEEGIVYTDGIEGIDEHVATTFFFDQVTLPG
jgi:peptide/nickel transport system substrate-binding protein